MLVALGVQIQRVRNPVINMNYKVTQLKPFGVLVEPKNEETKVQDLDIENLRQFI